MKYIINESKVGLLKDNFLMSYVKDNVEIFDNFILIQILFNMLKNSLKYLYDFIIL